LLVLSCETAVFGRDLAGERIVVPGRTALVFPLEQENLQIKLGFLALENGQPALPLQL